MRFPNLDEEGRPFARSPREQSTDTINILSAIERHLAVISEFTQQRNDYQNGRTVLQKNQPVQIRGVNTGRRSFVLTNLGSPSGTGNVYVYKDISVMIQAGNTTIYNGSLILIAGYFSLSMNSQAVWAVSDTNNVTVNWTED